MKRTNPGYGKFGSSWRGAGGYADRLSHSFRGVKRLRLQDCRERPMCRSAGGMSRVVPLADFALIRRFAPPSPPGGRLLRQSLVVRDSADFLVRLRSRTEQIRTAEGSLPPGGEGGAAGDG